MSKTRSDLKTTSALRALNPRIWLYSTPALRTEYTGRGVIFNPIKHSGRGWHPYGQLRLILAIVQHQSGC